MLKLLFKKKLSEVRLLFKIRLKRLITPLGRVAVLKSLILSKLVHVWILLQNPPDDLNKKKTKCVLHLFGTKNKTQLVEKHRVIKVIKDVNDEGWDFQT